MTLLQWVIKGISSGQGFPCLFHFLTGFYCPGCGGTRAVRALLRGDVVKSFCYHPFVLYAVIAALAEGGFWLKTLLEGKQKGKRLNHAQDFHRRYGRWVLGALWIVGVNWALKNGFLLAGVDLLVLLGE